MFEKLKRKLGGVASPGELVARCDQIMVAAVENKNWTSKYHCLEVMAQNPDWLRGWKDYFLPELRKAADVQTRARQWLNLRGLLLDHTENFITHDLYYSKKFSDEDRLVLNRLVAKACPDDEVPMYMFQVYVYGEASAMCLRLLLQELFDDTKEHDYFAFYSDTYRSYMESVYEGFLAKELNRGWSPTQELGPHWKYLAEEARKQILAGKNYQYDREALKRARQKEEEEEKKKIPPKQATVSDQQRDKLAAYLVERVKRLENGELYALEGYTPKSPINAIFVDSGLMLIGLLDCVEERETALKTVREVLYETVKYISQEEAQKYTTEQVSLASQIELLEMYEQNKETGPLSMVCIVAFCLLCDIDLQAYDAKGKAEFGRLAAPLIDDLWEVIARTKQVFGWDIEHQRIFKKSQSVPLAEDGP